MARKSGGPLTRMGGLIAYDPEKAKAEILAAIDAAQGNRTRAGKALGADYRTLVRWIGKLAMWPAVDALCERKGYDVQPGPGRGKGK
jgi:hypothetical protein